MTGSPAVFLYSALNRALIACRAAYLCSCIGVKNFNWADKVAFPAQQHPTAPLPRTHTMGLLHYLGVTGLEEP
jgi:hypothetical protein